MGSRATIIKNDNLKDYSFNVYAFNRQDDGTDGTVFMGTNDEGQGNGGVNISYQDGKWNYTKPEDLKYWPTDALNFYAVSPVSDPIYTWQISQNKKEIDYLSYDEYDDGIPYTDVMYAVATKKSLAENGGTVQLQFKHITSQIVFMAKKLPVSNMNVEIKSIKLHNFKHRGTFKIPTDGSEPKQSDWSYITLPTQEPNYVIKDEKIDVKTDATDISTRTPMFLIPQPLTRWDTSHDIETANTKKESYLSIECKISIDGSYRVGSESGYGTLYVPFGADWQPGKRYVYTLIFGGGYDADGNTILQPIDFEPSVKEWVEDTKNSTTGNDIPLYQ